MKTVKEFEQKLVKENPEIWDFLRQLRRKKVIKVIFFCALVIFGTVMTMPSMKTPYMRTCTCLFCLIVCFLIAVSVSPKKVFWGKRRFGVIEEIKVTTHIASGARGYRGYRVTVAPAREKVCHDLMVRFEGEEHRRKGRKLIIPSKYGKCFEKGDRILQYEPLDYPILLEDTTERKRRFCHLCHAVMKNGERKCDHCGARLILFEDNLFEDWYIT